MSQCFQSSRIAGRCGNCSALAKLVHCPRHLKVIACELCCPVCSSRKEANEAMQVIESKGRGRHLNG